MGERVMLQRCWDHDYCAPSFYMVTVVTEPRRDCLGTLTTEVGGKAAVALSPFGEVVRRVWWRTSAVVPGVEACEFVVMPDHFHGILWVKERLARPMGHVVKAFKRVSEQECGKLGLVMGGSKGLLPEPNPLAPGGEGSAAGLAGGGSRGLLPEPNPLAPGGEGRAAGLAGGGSRAGAAARAGAGSVPAAAPAAGLWQEGFHDTILLHRGQLQAMVRYIADNPRRLALKRSNPSLFTVVSDLEVAAGLRCAAIGNRFLLERPLKRQVQVSRRIPPVELAALQEELLHAARHGVVLVSPCISSGEKAIARAALDAGLPLIVLLANGFAPQYKPPGRHFDACAAGRLLLLAPFPFERQRQAVTREQCLALNTWAATICRDSLGPE